MSNISVCFTIANGVKITLSFSPETTIKEMIQKYFEYAQIPPEERKEDSIIFIYNASKIPFDSQTPINKYFKTFNNAKINIVVLDLDNRLNS